MTTPGPGSAGGPVPGRLRVAIVAANTFEFESRLLKTALTLADDGHAVTVVAFAGHGLPAAADLAERVALRRIRLDRRIALGLRPLPDPVRAAVLRATGLAPDAEALPVGPAVGPDRLRAPLRRGLEILAVVRRSGAWTRAVAGRHRTRRWSTPRRSSPCRSPGRRRSRTYGRARDATSTTSPTSIPNWPVSSGCRGSSARSIRRRERGLSGAPPASWRRPRRWPSTSPAASVCPSRSSCSTAPPAWRPETPGRIRSDRLATALGLEPGPERPAIVLYQGAFRVDQGIEELVAASDDPALVASGAMVVFLGFGHLGTWLRAEAARRPGRMAVLPAVPEGELLEWTAGADVAFVGAPPRTAQPAPDPPQQALPER